MGRDAAEPAVDNCAGKDGRHARAKLQRQTTLKLGQVQDLAGVRVDADMVLTHQTELAEHIAEHFGAARSRIKDMRETPHSGYRAVHVWLALPAGRVEVQIRTLAQSEWANAYEDFAELLGRGIRYGERHENADVRLVVDKMHRVSEIIALREKVIDAAWEAERAIEELAAEAALDPMDSLVNENGLNTAQVVGLGRAQLAELSETLLKVRSQIELFVQILRELRRDLQEEEEV